MPEKSFFAAVYLKGVVYTFGGYDIDEKIQLKSCEYFNVSTNVWHNNESVQLSVQRSQCSA